MSALPPSLDRLFKSYFAESCLVPFSYLKIFQSKSEAICLAAIVQIAHTDHNRDPEKHAKRQCWFLLSSKSLQALLRISASQENRIVASLRNRGFIETKMIGMPARRWCRVVPDAIYEATDTCD